MGIAQMDATEAELLLQVEMLVNDNARVPRPGYQRQQTLAVDGFLTRLAQMQQIQTFLKEGTDYLVFLYEELGRGQEDKFHEALFFSPQRYKESMNERNKVRKK